MSAERVYEFMSPEFEAEIIADMLANLGVDAEHQGDDTILFSDEAAGRKVRFRIRVELE